MFCKKVFTEISQNSQENTCARISFLIKLQTRLQLYFKKRFWRRCFPVNFEKFLRTTFFTEHVLWLLLPVRMSGQYTLSDTSDKSQRFFGFACCFFLVYKDWKFFLEVQYVIKKKTIQTSLYLKSDTLELGSWNVVFI